MALLSQHSSTPVRGRIAQFAENWRKLSQDPWINSTITGYQLTLQYCPKRHHSAANLREDQRLILQSEIHKLVEIGAVQPIKQLHAHITSPMFVVPKSGGGLRPIIDLRYLNFFLEPPHFKMEGLYMLPSIISLGWFMVKIDLKDTYLTILIAQNFQSLLAFQATPQEVMQFQCLPFRLCTAPFVFSKVTKPITQFLRQSGIHLIMYLDDLMLAAPSKNQLLQDLSTTLWLFTALDFIVNIPKSVTVPTQCLEFLGFVINTQTMTLALPQQKIHSIQKEARHLLSLDAV